MLCTVDKRQRSSKSWARRKLTWRKYYCGQDAAAQYKQNTGKDVSVSVDSANFLPAKDDPHDPWVTSGVYLV
jgi:hypothetical protein